MKILKKNPYLTLNLFFTGLILMIFIYSAIFSAKKDNHPIPSFYEEFTGKKSPTSGLSRSFSEIIRLDFKEAKKWNVNGIPIFLFFLTQLLLRITTSIIIVKKPEKFKLLVWFDSIVSVLLFLLCFKNLLAFWTYF